MADPYVRWAPANVGACSATWYVGPEAGWRAGSDGTNPTFGQPIPGGDDGVSGAWGFLVPGPLKDTLTKEFVQTDPAFIPNMMQAWADAGGEISIMGIGSGGSLRPYGAAMFPFPVATGTGTQQMAFYIDYDQTLYPAITPPIRWVVKFSVAHSVTQ